jgi:hypothetical protein
MWRIVGSCRTAAPQLSRFIIRHSRAGFDGLLGGLALGCQCQLIDRDDGLTALIPRDLIFPSISRDPTRDGQAYTFASKGSQQFSRTEAIVNAVECHQVEQISAAFASVDGQALFTDGEWTRFSRSWRSVAPWIYSSEFTGRAASFSLAARAVTLYSITVGALRSDSGGRVTTHFTTDWVGPV